MAQVALDTSLLEVLGAKSAFLRRLENLGIKTVRDLLWHFPSRYEDFSKIYGIAELEPGQQATIQGVVEEVHLRRSWRRQMSIVEAIISDDTGTIRAIWFNQPYLANTLKVGRQANFSGKVSLSEESEMYLNHPAYEVLRTAGNSESGRAGQETKHTARLVPVYPETRGLTSRGLRFIMESVLRRVTPLKEWIPETTLASLGFPRADEAIRTIHFPKHHDEAVTAEKRFAFEELFLLQIFNLKQKLKFAAEKASAIKTNIESVKAMLAALPFELTASQKKSLWEIIKDIEKPRPMNRLLQGDVGSGKTVVAAIAAVIASENGYQTAFMAPTEILAHQHFKTMKELLAKFPAETQPAIGLLTGSSAEAFYENDVSAPVSRVAMAKSVADGKITVIFGTHALIQKTVAFKNLGLVIVDEQHRFGVRQRAELAEKKNGLVPHFLSMSATPIPRTLMLTVFGDLDISLITELPYGRKPVETKIITPIERDGTYSFIKKRVREGRQVFVICPRIEPRENGAGVNGDVTGRANPTNRWSAGQAALKKLELKSVKEEYEKLHTKIFPDLRVGMLHGQMKSKEKEITMGQFKEGTIDVLVATSVVEVGVDIPNATIMMIEGSDRFGLAQLYQFRGRVGRGAHQSYCFLLTDSKGVSVKERLKAIMEAKNGFELAEKDLKIRGPGEFLGTTQTGLPDVAMRALQDPALVKSSREAAVKIIETDPQLKKSSPLRVKLEEFTKLVHLE